jgi:hypothetical protein
MAGCILSSFGLRTATKASVQDRLDSGLGIGHVTRRGYCGVTSHHKVFKNESGPRTFCSLRKLPAVMGLRQHFLDVKVGGINAPPLSNTQLARILGMGCMSAGDFARSSCCALMLMLKRSRHQDQHHPSVHVHAEQHQIIDVLRAIRVRSCRRSTCLTCKVFTCKSVVALQEMMTCLQFVPCQKLRPVVLAISREDLAQTL